MTVSNDLLSSLYVWIDPTGADSLDMSFLGTEIEFIDDLGELIDPARRLMVVSAQPHLWDEGFTWLKRSSDRRLSITIPRNMWNKDELSATVAYFSTLIGFSIDLIKNAGSAVIFNFSYSSEDRRPVRDIITAFEVGHNFANPLEAEQGDSKYRELVEITLELLEYLGSESNEICTVEETSPPLGDTVIVATDEYEELKRLAANYSYIEQKYESLANSKLGKITLRMWERGGRRKRVNNE